MWLYKPIAKTSLFGSSHYSFTVSFKHNVAKHALKGLEVKDYRDDFDKFSNSLKYSNDDNTCMWLEKLVISVGFGYM